jgi:hypothetical protein
MRGDGRLGLIILAAGIAPALIKKSKPMARYLGDQFVRFGEYLKEGSDEVVVEPPPKVETAEAVEAEPEVAEAPPKVEPVPEAEAKPHAKSKKDRASEA